MKVESTGAVLSTVFVDYDNIYLSLKRKNEEAAKRFAKDAALWLREIENGRLITPTNSGAAAIPRRIVMSRCYGNPVPRRNATDNSTDMNSFPFVRHHFLRAGFEVVDCPPLTAQLKNSADIRMVMDVRDMLTHETRFDEFILLSGDADFTPVLHRLRAHARRTVVFANDHTAQPYTAISDGEIREADLITLLLEGRIGAEEPKQGGALRAPSSAELEILRKTIVAEVVSAVRGSAQPMPLEALADRAVRVLGHDKTVGTSWAGAGTFRDLLSRSLPQDIKLSEQPPYVAFEPARHIARDLELRVEPERPRERERRPELPEPRSEARYAPFNSERPQQAAQPPQPQQRVSYDPDPRPAERPEPRYEDPRYALPRETRHALGDAPASPRPDRARDPRPETAQPSGYGRAEPAQQPAAPYGQSGFFAPPPDRTPLNAQPPAAALQPEAPPAASAPYGAPRSGVAPQQQPGPARSVDQASQIQQSIARIHEACQAPPLSPPEYRVLFEVMAEEISANNLSGQQTLINIVQRAREMGLEVRRDDVRFVLEVVSEADPWFEQGASANLFASRFRNFVVARCRSQGLSLSADEIDLIDAWFGGAPPSQRAQQAPAQGQRAPAAPPAQGRAAPPSQPQLPQGYGQPLPPQQGGWQGQEPQRGPIGGQGASPGFNEPEEEFPRIVRSRLRG